MNTKTSEPTKIFGIKNRRILSINDTDFADNATNNYFSPKILKKKKLKHLSFLSPLFSVLF